MTTLLEKAQQMGIKPAGATPVLNKFGQDVSGHAMNPLNPNNQLSILNPVQGVAKNFFKNIANIGSGLVDNFGGAGANDLKTAVNPTTGPVKAPLRFLSGLAKAAYSDAAFIPQGIFNTTKDFVTEAFKPGQSNLSKTIDAGLHTDSGTDGLAQGNNLANGFLNGLGQTIPFLSLFGEVNDGTIKNSVDQKLGPIRENLQTKEAALIDQKLGLAKNTKLAQNQRAKVATTGSKTPGQVLTENKIPLDQNTVPTLDEHIAVRQATKQALLKTEDKWGNLDDLATQAKKDLTSTGTDRIKASRMIDQEVTAYKTQYGSEGQIVNGKLRLPLDQIDKIKSNLYSRSYGNGLTNSDALSNKTLKGFAKSLKQGIENGTDNQFIKDLNRQEGDFINAKTLLQNKDTALLNKSSLPSRLSRKVVGAVVGSAGGPIGAAVGAEAADYIGEVLSNQNIPSVVRNMIIDNLKNDPIGETILQKAQALLRQRLQEQIKTPQLEGNKTIFAGPRTQTETPIQVQEAGKAIGRITSKEAQQSQFTKTKLRTGGFKTQYLSSPKDSVK